MTLGRPTLFNQEIVEDICTRLEKGESLVSITNEDGYPDYSTFCRWLAKEGEEYDKLRNRYARARELQQDYYAEEILRIADDAQNDFMVKTYGEESVLVENKELTNRSRLRIDSRKWLMSKLAPKKYGDKQEVTHRGSLQAVLEVGDGTREKPE